ncbi:MAG TPA: TonB-dependent receptor [Leeuwenhoekiella sp.]|nr:TonB-dependent receptor [Leeuwenhoekiella sp.]
MKSYLIWTLVLFISLNNLFAQPAKTEATGSVIGKVIDKDLDEPIPYASVSINTAQDVLSGTVTTDSGEFEITGLPDGNYTLKIQFMGYESFSKTIAINKAHRSLQLGIIPLKTLTAELDAVNIVAERTTIEQRIDRKVINVGKDLTTSGATASDIMNNVPSVSVDQQTGALSLRGNSNVQVMVDGKLSNIPPAQLLKQIPSTSIKKIELITNPSAKYNPDGMSGIINIVLYKSANIGFNGDISTGLSYDENPVFNSGINLNYRNGKLNVYTNYSNNFGKYHNPGNIYRPDENSDQILDFLSDEKSHLIKAGIDYYINDHHTLSFFVNRNSYNGFDEGNVDIIYPDASRNLFQLFVNESANHSEQYNLDYKINFKKEDHSLELEIDQNNYKDGVTSSFDFSGRTPLRDYIDLIGTQRQRSTISLDYVNPLHDDAKLEFGAQAILFSTDVGYSSTGFSFNASGNLVPTRSTAFNYDRDIYALYATYGKNYEKWSYQMGIRAEQAEVVADTNAISAFKNDYLEFYPSAYVTFNPSEKNQYQVSYSRRVDRPGINQVNPIRKFSTPLITQYGNTDLTPQFTNSFEANYTRKLEKGSITGGIFYRVIEDQLNQAFFIDRFNLDRVILTYDNFDNTSSYGLELSSNYKPTAWWDFNASFDLYHQSQTGISEELNPNIEQPTAADIRLVERTIENTVYNVRMSNNFKLGEKLTLSAFGMYRGLNKGLQFTSKPMFMVNTGLRYEMWDGAGTVSLNYNDILNTMRSRFTGNYPYTQEGQFEWESNTIYLGINYRFGKTNFKAKKRKQRENNEQSAGGVF